MVIKFFVLIFEVEEDSRTRSGLALKLAINGKSLCLEIACRLPLKMMIAARSALDVEPSSYSSIHQHQSTNFCINNSESPPTLDSDINCNMSFPFISNGGEQSSPSFRASFENDYDGSRDRLSSSEDGKCSKSIKIRS